MIELLSSHLYSSPDVYVRELVQNSVDALIARGTATAVGAVVIECHERPGRPPVVSVEDEGTGLTAGEVHELLATIGSSSKRDDLIGAHPDYLGRFGIGLLSCFLVSDEIRLMTRSVRGGPGVSWLGRSDGTYDLRELADGDGRSRPGTTVWLTARAGFEQHLREDTVRRLISHYAGLLAQPVVLRTVGGDEVIGGGDLPWVGRSAAELVSWAEAEFDQRFLDAVPLALPAAGLTGVALVLPDSPSPAARQRHQVHLKRMLLSQNVDGLLPDWAFFVRVVVDTSALQPLASREALYEDAALLAVREGLGEALRSWLTGLAVDEPDRLRRLVRVHALALKALAVHDDDLLRLFLPWLPVETTQGPMTLGELVRRGPVRYASTTEDFSQMAQVATAQGLCLVNAGFTYDEELLLRLADVVVDVDVERMDPEDLAAALGPVPSGDLAASLALAARSSDLLSAFRCTVEVRSFEPSSVPALYTAGDDARFSREISATAQVAGGFWGPVLQHVHDAGGDRRTAVLVLNWRHPLVPRLAGRADDGVLRTAVEVLYLQALLLGRHPLRGRESTLLSGALVHLLEGTLDGPR